MPTTLTDAKSPLLSGSTGFFLDETGYGAFSDVFGSSGMNTLAFGVVDVTYDFGASGLAIDNVTFTTSASPVPESETSCYSAQDFWK
jgi:hypothetical protein